MLGPPFTALSAVAETIKGTNIGLAAQNLHWEDKGAFTGEVSPAFLAKLDKDEVFKHFQQQDRFVGRQIDGRFGAACAWPGSASTATRNSACRSRP